MIRYNSIMLRFDKLKEEIEYLRSLVPFTFEQLSSHPHKIPAAKRALQVSIMACLDIGIHLIAKLKLERPRDKIYEDVFIILGKNNILSPDFADKFAPLADYRDRLIYLDRELSDEELYEIIQNELPYFEEFAGQMIAFVERHKKEKHFTC